MFVGLYFIGLSRSFHYQMLYVSCLFGIKSLGGSGFGDHLILGIFGWSCRWGEQLRAKPRISRWLCLMIKVHLYRHPSPCLSLLLMTSKVLQRLLRSMHLQILTATFTCFWLFLWTGHSKHSFVYCWATKYLELKFCLKLTSTVIKNITCIMYHFRIHNPVHFV